MKSLQRIIHLYKPGTGHLSVVGRQSVNQEKSDICLDDRLLGLLAHPAFETVLIGLFHSPRINDLELQIANMGIGHPAVAGNARRIIDKRKLLANQPVEQGGLAHIGPADNGYCKGHGLFASKRSANQPAALMPFPARMLSISCVRA